MAISLFHYSAIALGAAEKRKTGDTAPAPAAQQPAAETPAAPADESLDVTITGEAKDEVPLVKTPPPLDLPFREVITLSREGQTASVLAQPVDHLPQAEQTKLMELDARQTVTPRLVRLAAPPFFMVETPGGVTAQEWEFQVVDQNSRVLHSLKGKELKDTFLEWDGYENGVFKVLVGPAYSPVLIVTDEKGKKRRTFGEPIQLDALQYEQDGLLHLEFGNDRLYQKGSADFAPEMAPLLEAALNIMRRRVGTPFRIIIYENADASALSQKRLDRWKRLLQEKLVIEAEDVTMVAMTPKERGRVTTFMMLAQP